MGVEYKTDYRLSSFDTSGVGMGVSETIWCSNKENDMGYKKWM